MDSIPDDHWQAVIDFARRKGFRELAGLLQEGRAYSSMPPSSDEITAWRWNPGTPCDAPLVETQRWRFADGRTVSVGLWHGRHGPLWGRAAVAAVRMWRARRTVEAYRQRRLLNWHHVELPAAAKASADAGVARLPVPEIIDACGADLWTANTLTYQMRIPK